MGRRMGSYYRPLGTICNAQGANTMGRGNGSDEVDYALTPSRWEYVGRQCGGRKPSVISLLGLVYYCLGMDGIGNLFERRAT
jgi:hypothetical protein